MKAPTKHDRGLTILVVDDSADAADTLALLLRVAGHQVHTAYSPAEALGIAERLQPDAVLLDIGMPRMDGYQVAEQLRARPETRDALIVAVTGYGRPDDRARSFDAGFDYHLVKPIDFSHLEDILALIQVGKS